MNGVVDHEGVRGFISEIAATNGWNPDGTPIAGYNPPARRRPLVNLEDPNITHGEVNQWCIILRDECIRLSNNNGIISDELHEVKRQLQVALRLLNELETQYSLSLYAHKETATMGLHPHPSNTVLFEETSTILDQQIEAFHQSVRDSAVKHFGHAGLSPQVRAALLAPLFQTPEAPLEDSDSDSDSDSPMA